MVTQFLKFSDNKVRKKIQGYITDDNITNRDRIEKVTSIILQYQNNGRYLSESFFRQYKDYIDFTYIWDLSYLSVDFIRQHVNSIDNFEWSKILDKNYQMNDQVINELKQNIGWKNISNSNIVLSTSFVQRNKEKIDWFQISKSINATEQFLQNHINEDLDWRWIVSHYILSEEFIEKHKDKIENNSFSYHPQYIPNQILERNKRLCDFYEKINKAMSKI